jgi:hypothetical protein
MKTIETNFIKPKVQQYTPIWDVLLDKPLKIMELCTPKGYTHSIGCNYIEQRNTQHKE